MMNERKLNIDAPLMSVRRSFGTSPSLTEANRKILEKPQTLPNYKSDTTLDQVTEPVAVPFNWEHIPGRSKDYDGSEPQLPTKASITPILPPGKSTNVAKQSLEKEPNVANNFRPPSISNSLSEKIDCNKEHKDEKMKKVEENDDYDDDGDVYSDALETLSPTEPLSMNCSVSDVSGLDNVVADMCGASSTDKQAHDFMMSRFLTAAKAMTIQPPQYASSRKQTVLTEQPREFIKLVPEQKKSFVSRHITDIVPYTGQCQEEEEEEEESDNETNDYANNSAKGCGLFPRLCVRNSLCLLNPVPGTKMGNQFPLYSAYEVGKPDKSSHIRSHRPAPSIKKAWDAINKSKSSSRAASPDKQDVRKKWTSESSRYTYSGELKKLGRLSPFRRSRAASAGVSPFQSKPQPPFPGAKLLGDSKQDDNNHSGKLKFPSRGHSSIQEVLSQGAKRSYSFGSLTVEKTLYIDTASTIKSSCSSSHSLGNTIVVGKDRTFLLDSFRDMKHLEALEENLDSQVLNPVDANSPTLSSMLHLMAKEDKAERLAADQEINLESMSLQLVPSSFDKDAEISKQQIVVVDDSGKVGNEYVLHPLAPPLPKSPSESWLCRALPLVSSKNSFPLSNQGTHSQAKRQGFSRASSYTKWETIVKSSNLNHDHVTCSKAYGI
ncbi:hypothetical protein GLYMA_05G159000v4 [Glycine max]|uniref:DUF688 domain-containing protein n=1 Tax=Glycine max TaxID=3847 RepID=K7KQI3_SOYBN|nr:uncharacterized protein LOC102665249 [Glycine max]XP_040871471.1 uncharacterized protein LOC102665249 [Glycine max]KAG4391325.1 hypothetical protein GLYMA_05G159000v4 [Glycine max]KAG4391326.1 hypothetical protein GLYMA_05G159000v4 [Glycine max]KAH1134662.1 hypothetical protein GYH30_012813 [Glycine max]KAH1134663.1 hypothetical protein GYH30_012813 [Glycine max]KAH1134664.1 hypothetical protein GYH30_012813 [Glycine max]